MQFKSLVPRFELVSSRIKAKKRYTPQPTFSLAENLLIKKLGQ